MHTLPKPYLVFLGESQNPTAAKTASGLRDWCPADVVGQYGLANCTVDLGLEKLSPQEAAERGARAFVIGVAPIGGAIPESWWPALLDAIKAGLDIVSGMHARLADVPGLKDAARARGRRLIEVRHTQQKFPVATGNRRSGKRLLTVGTDCALGKKYTALAIARALSELGVRATFRATGQTGIMIAGSGVALDAVVADFIAGAAEALSPDNDPDHWDVIEGQGALFHPAYGGVTLGLIHGSQPDALVLCHDPSRTHVYGYPAYQLPALAPAMAQYLTAARVTNPGAEFVGISLNTKSLSESERKPVQEALRSQFGLPVFDPIRDGAGELASYLAGKRPLRKARGEA